MNQANLTEEELEKILLEVGLMNEEALKNLEIYGSFTTLGEIGAAATTMAGIMDSASGSPNALLTIGMSSRDSITNILNVSLFRTPKSIILTPKVLF